MLTFTPRYGGAHGLVKSDLREPLLYAAVLTLLLGLRLWFQLVRSRTRKPTPNEAESQLSRV